MKKNMIKILIILVIILLALTGVVYFATDLFKTPRTLFYKYLINGNVDNVIGMNYDEFLEQTKVLKSYENSGSLKFSLNSTNVSDITLANELDKIDISYNYKVNSDSKKEYLNLIGNYNSKQLTNIELMRNNSIIGIREKDLDEKYIAIDTSKMKETSELIGMNQTDTDLYNYFDNIDLYNIYYISKEDRNTIINTYKDILYNSISKKNYTVEKNVNIKANGENYKCKAYKLTMTNEEISKLYTNVLETLKGDDLTLNLIVEKYNMLYQYNKITKEELAKNIQKEIDKESFKNIEDGSISIVVYESNSRTIRTEIVKNNENAYVDTTKNKDDLTILCKINSDKAKEEILYNEKNISENEQSVKIIFTKGNTKFKVNIKNKTEYDSNNNIEDLDESNSNNISEMNEETFNEFRNKLTNSIEGFLTKKINILGIQENLFMNTTIDNIQLEDKNI